MEKKKSKKIIELTERKKKRLMQSFCADLNNKVRSINLKTKENEREK